MAAFSLPPPVLALMERTLFATSATAKTSYLEKTINDARNVAAAQLRALETDSPDPVAYALGAIDLMSVMLVRARERHDGDRAFALARRKHVLPLLRALAKSKQGLRPSELADTLGLNRPKVSDLLGKMDALQLTARSPLTDGGQDRRRQRIEPRIEADHDRRLTGENSLGKLCCEAPHRGGKTSCRWAGCEVCHWILCARGH